MKLACNEVANMGYITIISCSFIFNVFVDFTISINVITYFYRLGQNNISTQQVFSY